MARQQGYFKVAHNYEVTSSLPLDARSLVRKQSDLTNPDSWKDINSLYNGLLVVVGQDTPDKTGVYILTNKMLFTQLSSWLKLADIYNTQELDKRLTRIEETSSSVVEVKTKGELPNFGNSNNLYYIKDENAIYKWDSQLNKYSCCGRDYNEIDTINGGNAIIIKRGV